MNREELLNAVEALPIGSEVELQLGGWYFEIVSVGFSAVRRKAVVEAFHVGEDHAAYGFGRYKVMPKDWGMGNKLGNGVVPPVAVLSVAVAVAVAAAAGAGAGLRLVFTADL